MSPFSAETPAVAKSCRGFCRLRGWAGGWRSSCRAGASPTSRAILVRMDINARNIATHAADAPATAEPTPVVGRFAPSPSGRMHLGNVFSCLCSWLSARSQGGGIVLRIEDLDDRCKRPELAAQLIDDLAWLGLEWDEGPYYQHDRLDLYERALHQLQDAGLTYPAFARAPNSMPRAHRTRATAHPSTAAPAEAFLPKRLPAAASCALRPRACACPSSTTSQTT